MQLGLPLSYGNKVDGETPGSGQSQEPETYEDEQFGTFEKKPTRSGYSTTAEWNGNEIELILSPTETGERLSGLSVAKELWDDQSAWNERIQQYALDELLELKNVEWIRTDEDTVTAEEFTDRMEPKTVTIGHDGRFTFWHRGNGLFFDHRIKVSGTLEEGITEAYL
ncbi:hypothetical protein C440_05852 [Haloferax mucosum ATCC BAA-1512]|uniref:DUF2262 domain-containing protein n=1 Tax=Haloferax mucosum ATCC BAA-1512 TaxID=662479 RepID=M0IJZ7_9EURY|nr:DUF2262 domain-containing protein [Haloferax mucosum]ELZ95789.1 hypothetical protein C440_05852 [Haloferax mucosum ATCC BAA-1512]